MSTNTAKVRFLSNVHGAYMAAQRRLEEEFGTYQTRVDAQLVSQREVHANLMALRELISDENLTAVRAKIAAVRDYITNSKAELQAMQQEQEQVVGAMFDEEFEGLTALLALKDEVAALNKEVVATVFAQYKGESGVLEDGTEALADDWVESSALTLIWETEDNVLLTGLELPTHGRPYQHNGENGGPAEVAAPRVNVWVNGEQAGTVAAEASSDLLAMSFDPMLLVRGQEAHVRIEVDDAEVAWMLSEDDSNAFSGMAAGQSITPAVRVLGIRCTVKK